MPLRLLFVSHSFPPPDQPLANIGGMQRVATELYAALGKHPEVALSGLLLRTSWRATHVRLVPFLLRLYGEVPRRVERHPFDVVLFSSMVTATLSLPLRRRLAGRPVALAAIVHGRDVTLPVAPYQWLVPRVFGALDAVLPVSSATGAACRARGLAERKLQVVPNGVDLHRFRPLASRHRMRAELTGPDGPFPPLPEDALLLCSVGRQVARKGFAWFVEEVMPRLPQEVHYWLAGEGPEAEDIQAAAQRHGLGQRVRLLGRLSDADLERLYRGADLFIMPNRPVPGDMEGFGIVMLEAGLCGLPTVAADLEGIRDVIAEGENGHLVESGNAQAFAEAVRPYLHHPDRLERDGRRAADHVARTFSWKAVADRYVRVLGRI